jgi:threonine dehydrogenase-like Zn-dependent dehydrogenase
MRAAYYETFEGPVTVKNLPDPNPLVYGCGGCPQCLSGNHQVCDHQFQPGVTIINRF